MGIRQDCWNENKPDPYVNRDPRCTHPPTEYDPIDYCFGYARAVDEDRVEEFIENSCKAGCDMWDSK